VCCESAEIGPIGANDIDVHVAVPLGLEQDPTLRRSHGSDAEHEDERDAGQRFSSTQGAPFLLSTKAMISSPAFEYGRGTQVTQLSLAAPRDDSEFGQAVQAVQNTRYAMTALAMKYATVAVRISHASRACRRVDVLSSAARLPPKGWTQPL
jgi:hypothetical protein